jgi:integrase/recombinase XerD
VSITPVSRPGGTLWERRAPPIPEHVAAGDEAEFVAFCLQWRRRQLAGLETWNDRQLLEGWLTECSPTASGETQKTYRRHLERFRSHVRRWQELPDLEQTDERLLAPGSPEAITTFAAQLRGMIEAGTMAKSSYNATIAAVSSFYKWCSDSTRRGFTGVPVTPMPSGLQMRLPTRKAKSLTPDQLAMVQLGARTCRTSPARGRDEAVIRLLYLLGTRATETVCLRWDDIELSDEHSLGGAVVHIQKGKGSKPRSIPVGAHVVEVLDRLKAAQPESEWLLPNPTDPRRHMSRQGLWKIANRAGKEAGVKFYCHLARHSHATHAWAATKDSKLIQATLGHSDISTTMGLYVDETAGDSSANYLN